MVEACLCEGGTSCADAMHAGLSGVRTSVADAVRSKFPTKGGALLQAGENCRANLIEV